MQRNLSPAEGVMNEKLTMNDTQKLLKTAMVLSIITITYNVAEGLISMALGYADETMALFGFGVDSFVEVVSGMGIAHMVWRMGRNPVDQRDRFEKTALYITGYGFFILTAGLVAGSILIIAQKAKPESTLAGIIISVISILTMYILYRYKLRTGTALDSAPIVADANCTKTCFYLSFVLLASSLIYQLFQVPYVDALGSMGIAWFAFSEGRESIEKARSGNLTCSCDGCCPASKQQ
jgi:divalent metal cation (Fe/Co/Zn/Cd) transporter